MKKLLLSLAILAATLTSTSVFAEQGDVTALGYVGGPHFKNDSQYNDFNYGLGVEYEIINRLSIGAKVYRNSYLSGTKINGQTPDMYSESVMIDYRFWNNDLWATHVGWQFSNHYNNADGTVFQHMKDMPYVNACRKIGEASSPWQACAQLTVWKDYPTGYNESLSFNVQYVFGKE